jgi:tetratricopeptide (TPR) repeat protein
MGWTLVRLGRILLHMGEWEQASAALQRSAQLLEDDERSAVYPSLHLAQLGAWRGEPGRAPAELEAVTAGADGRDRWVLCYGSRILAELDLLAGRSAAARDRLAPLLEGTHKDDPLVLLLFAPLAWAWLELNEPERTEGTLAEGMERAQMRQHQPATVDLLRVQGMLRARQGRCEEARRSLEEAVALAYQMPDPYREALCRAELAVVADRMGDKTLASEAGDAALAIVRALEAGPCTRYIEGRTTERGAEPRTRR